MHYFNNLRDALSDKHSAELPDGTKVQLYQGKAASISIDQDRRTVDLSQDIDGTNCECSMPPTMMSVTLW